METEKKKIFKREWMFPYVFLFSFLWEYLIVGVFQIHPLQDQFYFDGYFDEVFIRNIAFASFILALACVVLRSLVGLLDSDKEGRNISFKLLTIGFVLLHGGIIPLLLFCFIWQTWPLDAYMTGQFYLAWIPAAVAGPALWWFLLTRLERKNIIVDGDGLIDDELARGSKNF